MKKFLLILAGIFTLFYGCEKSDETHISLRAKNLSGESIIIFFVQGETLKYDNIEIGETTVYQSWEYGNSKPDTFEVRTASGTAGPFIYNYTSEGARLENGSYTMEIDDNYIVHFIKD